MNKPDVKLKERRQVNDALDASCSLDLLYLGTSSGFQISHLLIYKNIKI